MLEITEFTEALLTNVTNRKEKHGDEDVPAVTLAVEITTANTILDAICPGLRHALYKAVEGQDQLPGVEPTTPVLRSNVIERVSLTTMHEGWRLAVDDGIDDTDPMLFGSVKVDKLKVDAKQGGSITLGVRLGTSDVDSERLGKLAMHNGQSIWIKLLKPEKADPVIDGSVEAFERDHPDASAEDLFAAGGDAQPSGSVALTGNSDPESCDHAAGTSDDEGSAGSVPGDDDAGQDGGTEAEQGAATSGFAPANEAAQTGENWPFPQPASNGIDTDEARAREQREIEAGMSQSIAAAGVAPKGRRGRKSTASVE